MQGIAIETPQTRRSVFRRLPEAGSVPPVLFGVAATENRRHWDLGGFATRAYWLGSQLTRSTGSD